MDTREHIELTADLAAEHDKCSRLNNQLRALTAERDTLKALCDKVREIVEQRQHDPAVRDGSDPGGLWSAGYNVCQKQIIDELKAALKTCDTRARSILK